MFKDVQSGDADRDLYSRFTRPHILYHASEELIFGLGMAEESARHGYRISPGTLYPLLDKLESQGYLRPRRKGMAGHGVGFAQPL